MTSAEKIAFMHTFFGECETEHKCKDCTNFERHRANGKLVRKCKVYGLSHSEATDWNANFTACGCFNTDTQFFNLYKTHTTSTLRVELPGQLELSNNDI